MLWALAVPGMGGERAEHRTVRPLLCDPACLAFRNDGAALLVLPQGCTRGRQRESGGTCSAADRR